MASTIVTDTRYNQEIQRSDRSVTQDARSITETTSNSTTVRSGGSRTIVVTPSSTTNAISPSQEVSSVVPSLSTSATVGAPTRQQKVASPAAKPVAPKSAPPTRQQQAAPSKQEISPRGAKLNEAERVKEAAITAKRQAALKTEISQIRAGSGTALEKQKKINEAQKKSFAVAQNRVNDTLDVQRYNRVTPHTQETILNRSERLQRLEAQGRIESPGKKGKTNKNTNTTKTKSAKTEIDKSINTNIKQEVVTSDSAFSTGERTKGTFNIGRFRAEVSGADSVLPTHSFLVVFAPMLWTRSKFSAQNLDSLLTMRCDNVVLPSVNLLQEQNIRRYGFGPVENVAYGVNVGDFTLQFIVDKEALVVEYFEEWLNRIVNRDSFGGANMNNDIDGRKPYEIAYKDTYSCPNVNVFVYDRSQNQVMTYNIYDVFPTGIQSMNMSWSEENTLMKLNITFSFTDLRINRIPPKNNKDDKSFKDQIIVTDTGRNSDGIFAAGGSGSALTTLNSGLELTDLTNETTIIGDFPGRIRGSVPPLPPATFQQAIVTDVPIPKLRTLTIA
jgi:hypothetical protein